MKTHLHISSGKNQKENITAVAISVSAKFNSCLKLYQTKKVVLLSFALVLIFMQKNEIFAQNIGIGTASPASKLGIKGGLSIGDNYAETYTAPANGLLIEGSVGIGTESPAARLDVKGSGNTTATYGFGVRNSANQYSFAVRDDGNVGVGTVSPAGKLQVIGSSMIYNTKTDVVQTGASGDQTVLLGLFTAGSSVKVEFYAQGSHAENGAEFNISGGWSSQPGIAVITDPSALLGRRLKLYFKPNGSPNYGTFWLAATWDNQSPGETSVNNLRFRFTSAADFHTSDTSPFTGYTLLGRSSESVPIGTVMAWHKNLAGVPGLPASWVECNGQTLADEASPLNGQVIPNLNGNNYFMRGNATSGGTGGASAHTHQINVQQYTNWDLAPDASHHTSGTLITAAEASNLPPYMNMVWIMKVK